MSWTLPPLPNLEDHVRCLLAQVPTGRVTTFGDIATALGDVRAARWVAEFAVEHANDASVPVHRLVRKTGDVSDAQRSCLQSEGCPLGDDGVDVEAARWPLESTSQPFRDLCDWQLRMAAAATLRPWKDVPATMGGVDLSYLSPREAIAAYASIDVASKLLRYSHTIRCEVPFPYIPGYLTFREAPVLLELLSEVRSQGALDPIVIVDGTGRLHPRRAGIGVALGLLADCTTIGVSKHQLCGRVLPGTLLEGCAMIEEAGEFVGAVLDGGSKRRMLFVSPGHGIDLESAIRVTRAVMHTQHLPLPTYHSDRLSRELVKASRSSPELSPQ